MKDIANVGNVNGWQVFNSGSGSGTITGATNGLSTSGTNIVLGGTLTGNTTIALNSNHNLCIVGTGTTSMFKNNCISLATCVGGGIELGMTDMYVSANPGCLFLYAACQVNVQADRELKICMNSFSGSTILDGQQKGISYAGNYCGNSKNDPRWIPDNAYVTGKTSTSGIQTVSNGLCKYGTNAVLGGKLTGSTTIDLNGCNFIICGAPGSEPFIELNDPSVSACFGTSKAGSTTELRNDKYDFTFLGCGNGAFFTDANCATAAGLKYSGDYSANYTCLSIPNAGWVTGHTCGGTITGGTNGLSTSGTNIILGGALTGNTTIQACANIFAICGAHVCQIMNNTATDQYYVDVYGPVNCNRFSMGAGCISLCSQNPVLCNSNIYIGGDNLQFVFWKSGKITNYGCFGSRSGLTYTADYSAEFVNESLVTKRYVDVHTGGGSITGGTNGLSVYEKNIGLGGTLTGETTINGAQTLNINQSILNLSGNTCVNITGNVKLVTTPLNAATATCALVWDSGTTIIKGYPVINEWVTSESGLTYTGQKFAYPTQTIMQTDVGTCVTIPNYIQICNINLKTVADTLIFTIPAGKTALLNRAKLIMLNDASPTAFSISIGNNACYIGNCSNNNIANLQQISNVLANETYELDLSTRHQGVPESCGSILYFRVGSGSTSICNLCAHLLVEGFVY